MADLLAIPLNLRGKSGKSGRNVMQGIVTPMKVTEVIPAIEVPLRISYFSNSASERIRM
jgi:hypothetical protein